MLLFRYTKQTRKNVADTPLNVVSDILLLFFNFTLKALLFLIDSSFELLNLKFRGTIKCLKNWESKKNCMNQKYILLNKLGSWEHSLVMKLGQFIKRIFIKKFYKKCGPETSFRPFCVYKGLNTASFLQWKMKFLKLTDYIGYVIAKLSKYTKINILIFL